MGGPAQNSIDDAWQLYIHLNEALEEIDNLLIEQAKGT